MKSIIIVVVAVALALRLWLRYRSRSSTKSSRPPLQLALLKGDVALVAAREVRTRVRGKLFRAGTLLMLVVVAAAIVIPVLVEGLTTTNREGVLAERKRSAV